MPTSLWPNLSGAGSPRGMFEMLYDAAGDISAQTNGAMDFYVDALGVQAPKIVQKVRYNCYVRVVKKNYMHLLFQVTTPVTGPFPASVVTPDDDSFPDLQDEQALRNAIEQILQSERAKDVVLYLLKTAS